MASRSRTGQRHEDTPADLPDAPDAPDTDAARMPADGTGEGTDPTAQSAGDATAGASPEAAAEGEGTDPTGDVQSDAGASTPEAAAEEQPKRPYVRKVLKDIPLSELGEEEEVPEAEWEQTPLTATAGERSEAQKVIDEKFKALFDKWVTAGRPAPRQSPRSRRAISPEHAPAMRKMITDAAKLYDVIAKFAPVAHDQHGREVIVYSPAERIKRPRKPAELPAGTTLATADTSVPSPSDGSLPGE